jgi:hypothetical protein
VNEISPSTTARRWLKTAPDRRKKEIGDSGSNANAGSCIKTPVDAA